MKHVVLIAVGVLMMLAFLVLQPTPVIIRASAAGCGIRPIKPIPPIGRKDLYAECRCNRDGDCYWEWVCVRN